MRWLNKIIAAVCGCAGLAGATEWTVRGGNSELDLKTGCGRLGGPVTFSSEEWTFTASREAIIRANPKIVRKKGEGGKASYKLDTSAARIVFFGQCEARNREGMILLQAPFMVFDVGRGMMVGQAGASYRHEDGSMKSVAVGSEVLIDLDTGELSVSEVGENPEK